MQIEPQRLGRDATTERQARQTAEKLKGGVMRGSIGVAGDGNLEWGERGGR